MFCNVPVRAVIECRDVDASIYELPLALQKEGMDELVMDLFDLKSPPPKKNIWIEIVRRILEPRHEVTIGVVGKYIELQDAYKSVYESITHAGIANNCKVNVAGSTPRTLKRRAAWRAAAGPRRHTGPGGFGERGTEGKIAAAQYAREKRSSLLRALPWTAGRGDRVRAKYSQASRGEQHRVRTEVPASGHQHDGGAEEDHRQGRDHAARQLRMRAGPGHPAARAYGTHSIRERHRHRYEVNNDYVGRLAAPLLVDQRHQPAGATWWRSSN